MVFAPIMARSIIPKIAKIKMTKIVAWVTLLTIGSDVNEIMGRVTNKASNTSAS